jgi:hypothetical protein
LTLDGTGTEIDSERGTRRDGDAGHVQCSADVAVPSPSAGVPRPRPRPRPPCRAPAATQRTVVHRPKCLNRRRQPSIRFHCNHHHPSRNFHPDPMPTIAPSSPPHRPPPGDADLQELYDQVLSAFAEESSPSNFSPTVSISRPNNVDHDPLCNPHSDETLGSRISSRPHTHSRG